MPDIDQGNIYITSGTLNKTSSKTGFRAGGFTDISGGLTVQVNTTQKIDHILQNPIVFLPIPVSRGNRGAIQPFTRALDIKRITETISIQGMLAEESNERAIDKKNNLISLAKTGGELTAVWGLGKYQNVFQPDDSPKTTGQTGVFIMKLQFTETANPEFVGEAALSTDASQDEVFMARSIAVQIQLGRGKDL